MATADTGEHGRRAASRRGCWPVAVAGLAMLSACGGTTEPAATNVTVATTVSTTTTIPPAPTTSIDFNRPVDQEDDQLPEDATAADVAAVVEDMRGQTDDVAEQMQRLVLFPDLASPEGAQILDVSVSMLQEEEGFRSTGLVQFRVPATADAFNQAAFDDLRARSWNRASIETTEGLDGSTTAMVFREPGTSRDDQELLLTTRSGDGPTTIDIDYFKVTEDEDDRFDLLAAWASELRLPRSATIVEVGVATAEDVATLAAVYELSADTAAEARGDVLDLVREDEFEVRASEQSGETAAPAVLVDQDGNELLLGFAATGDAEVIAMTVTTSFSLTPLD